MTKDGQLVGMISVRDFGGLLTNLPRNKRMAFPMQRMRRTRETEPLRRMVRETTLSPSDFIYPVFVTEGGGGVNRSLHAGTVPCLH